MRVINVMRNSIYSLIQFFSVAILSFGVRKIFTVYLSVDLLGLEGFFSNAVAMLSLAEMGIGSIISYQLFSSIAKKDIYETNMLLNIYRCIYKYIGISIIIISIILCPFISYIVKPTSIDSWYIYLVYWIQIGIVLSSYFLAYRRIIFTASQKDYVLSKIDLTCNVIKNIGQIAAIVIFKEYTLYAMLNLLFNIIANVIVVYISPKYFPYLQCSQVTLNDIKKRNIFHDIKNFFIHKISYLVYGSTDAIIITSLISVTAAGLYANYLLIRNGINQIIDKALQGIVPSLGELVNKESDDKIYQIFCMLDLAYFMVSMIVGCSCLVVMQPFINLFFGDKFLLSDSFVFAFCFLEFIGPQFNNAYNFRMLRGNYEQDRNFMVLAAVANLVCSIIGAYYLGISGIMWGTIIAFAFIAYGRIRFVFNNIIHESMLKYIAIHLFCTMIFVLISIALNIVLKTYNPVESYIDLMINLCICIVGMLVIQSVFFFRTKAYRDMLVYSRSIVSVIKSKL